MLGRADDGVELDGRVLDFSGAFLVWLDRRDLGLGARDRLRHIGDGEANAVLVRRFRARGKSVLQLLDRVEHLFRVGMAVAARVFVEKPAPALGFLHGRGDRLEVGFGQELFGGGLRHRSSNPVSGRMRYKSAARIFYE